MTALLLSAVGGTGREAGLCFVSQTEVVFVCE